jgi:hypothetical protein
MAKRGTIKAASVDQENYIAKKYRGKRSVSSGAAAHDAGDVRTFLQLIECKMTGNVLKPAKSISVKLQDVEKICDEAYAEGRTPALALRIYNPSSVLADVHGNIDMILRLVRDDCGNWNVPEGLSTEEDLSPSH